MLMAVIVAFALLGGAVGTVQGSILSDVSFEQRAEFDFMATEAAPGASGTGRVELKIDIPLVEEEDENVIEEESGSEILDVELRVDARGEGLSPEMVFSLCIDGMLVGTENADDQGRVRLDVDLEGDEAMFDNLVGLMVTIHEGSGCDGTAVLHHTISELDLK